jgi:NAD(P)-dependent dehydrogenase (short-subunit alcohol dehydrogenase family)
MAELLDHDPLRTRLWQRNTLPRFSSCKSKVRQLIRIMSELTAQADAIRNRIPLGRMGRNRTIASHCCLLCTEEGSSVSAQMIVVNGIEAT